MDKRSFQQLLDKYLNGKATSEEARLVEQYTDRFLAEDRQSVFSSAEEREAVRQELYKRIRIQRQVPFAGWWKIAAAAALLIGLSVGLWMIRGLVFTPETVLVSTGNGERQLVRLSDGSQVQLNAGSTLEYPRNFDDTERWVKLSGEAYFKVQKDAGRAFEVEANGVRTIVLGTEFNVSAYPEDENVSVSLLEGAVKVEGLKMAGVLKPMEQAIFDPSSGNMHTTSFDPTSVTAWRTGSLIFDRTTFAQLARTLKRQFGVDVRFAGTAIEHYTVSGRFDDPRLAIVLASVTAAKELNYKMISANEVLIYHPE